MSSKFNQMYGIGRTHTTPCKDCQDRCPHCHQNCQRYYQYKQQLVGYQEIRRKRCELSLPSRNKHIYKEIMKRGK